MSKNLPIVGNLQCLWSGKSICGEGPLWDQQTQSLYWVDIDGCKAHCLHF